MTNSTTSPHNQQQDEKICYCGYAGVYVLMPDGKYQKMKDVYVRGCIE